MVKLATTLLALSVGLGACGKKSLDGAVDRLVKAAMKNDYQEFRAMSVAGLPAKFPKRKFALLSRTLKELGSYQERTMRGIESKTGGIRKGRYKLRFSKGKVDLVITLKRGRLIQFRFEGDDFQRAMARVSGRVFRKFRVTNFEWADATGKPRSNLFKVGDKVKFRMNVTGLTRKGRAVHLKCALEVKAPDGKVILNKPNFLDKTIPLPKHAPPVATVRGTLALPGKGTFKVRLVVTDVHGQRSLTYHRAVVLE